MVGRHNYTRRRACRFKAWKTSMSLTVRLLTAAIGFMAMLLWTRAPVMAHEAVSQEEPTSTSVDESVSSIERSFTEKAARPGLFPRLKEELKDADPFFRDIKLDVNLRTFYFYRDNYPNSTPQINEAWAIGGAVSYKSGWFLNHFGLGAVLYTSQPLYAPDDRDGTQLLKTGQEGYTVLGQLYGRVKLIEDHYINLYRYEYNTPFINKDDGRMTPKTFEGYTVQGSSGGKDGAPGFRYGGGYITKIKERNSDDFVSMSRDAGAPVDRGVALGGALFSLGRFSVGAIDYYSEDVLNIGYAEAKYTWPVTQKLGLLFAAQFTDQRSVGDDLLQGVLFLGQPGRVENGSELWRCAPLPGLHDGFQWSGPAEPLEQLSGLHQRPGEGFQPGKGESLSCEGGLRLHAPWPRRSDGLCSLCPWMGQD